MTIQRIAVPCKISRETSRKFWIERVETGNTLTEKGIYLKKVTVTKEKKTLTHIIEF